MLMLNSVIRIRFDPAMKRIRVAKNQPESWKISTKNLPISQEYHTFFFKNIKLLFNVHKYIFNRKKIGIFSILGLIRSRIRIRIRYSTKLIWESGSGSISKWNGSGTLVELLVLKNLYLLQISQLPTLDVAFKKNSPAARF